jgi:integrase
MLADGPNFERKLDELCQGLPPYIRRHLLEKISRENTSTIIEYIDAIRMEGTNLSTVYKQAVVDTLTSLAKFHPGKSFKDMSREDIIAFLNRLRKTEEQDKKHGWIGTYNQNIRHLKRFYRWLCYPLVESKQRPVPEQMVNVNPLPRKEYSNYEDHELWLDPDCNRLFLKYCPSARDRAFHTMMFDTSCRPKELMTAKIEDVQFIDEGYNQRHAIIRVVGKSGKRIKKMLYDSLPYVKDWLQVHPTPSNPQAYLLCGQGNRNRGRKLNRRHYSHMYNTHKKYFQSLLNSPDVPAEDKEIIKNKMLTKPWKPYVLRYTSLTEKANGMLSEYQLREHADWTPTSQMPRKYLRFRGDESIKALQRVHGIVPITEEHNLEPAGTLAPALVCYNCKELNKAGSRVCSSCKMILNFELLQQEKNEKIEEMEKKLNFMYQALQTMQVIKDYDEAQKKLLLESDKMRQIEKERIQEEEMIINDLQA